MMMWIEIISILNIINRPEMGHSLLCWWMQCKEETFKQTIKILTIEMHRTVCLSMLCSKTGTWAMKLLFRWSENYIFLEPFVHFVWWKDSVHLAVQYSMECNNRKGSDQTSCSVIELILNANYHWKKKVQDFSEWKANLFPVL